MRNGSRFLVGSVACFALACHRSEVARRDASSGEVAGGPAASGPVAPGRLDAHRSFGAEIAVANLQVWPIVSDQPADVGPYLTLQEAQEKKVARVHEVERGAEVNQLVVENSGDLPILICAGTLVKGGQQDRQIGQDLIVLARSTVPVGVYCVEQGRWTGASEGFCAAGPMATAGVRASAQYEGDQREVWDEVALVDRAAIPDLPPASSATGGTSTGSLVSAFECSSTAITAGRNELETKVRARFDELFAAKSAVVGFAYAIDGKPVTVRAFADARLLQAQLGPFVSTMAMEAQLAGRGRPPAATDASPPRATIDDVLALVRSASTGPEETVATEGGYVNRYRKGELAASSACLLPANRLGALAITEDWTARPTPSRPTHARPQVETQR